MARGRKRKLDPTIPAHIDQAAIPRGLYWDKSGSGRWYVRAPRPEGGTATPTVAGPKARLSDLHAIMEQRAGKDAAGTIGYVMTQFAASTEYAGLSKATRKDYDYCASIVRATKTKIGCTLDAIQVDKVPTPAIETLIETIAKGTPESRPGAGDAVPGYPSKANHLLRYLRRLCAWGIRFGHCKTNPAEGVKQKKERRQKKMPEHDAYAAVLKFARERGALKPHTLGSLPPYLWPVMEISYLCRMRGIEAVRLTDAHASDEGLTVRRVKGSRDNVVRWTPRLRAAWNAALALRAEILGRKSNRGRPIPIRPEDRFIVISESGTPLSKAGLDNAWQDLIHAAMESGVITAAQRFSLHGLKHRGITDTKGNRADKQTASGHKSAQTLDRYDHEVPAVDAADAPDIPSDDSADAV